MAFLDNSGDIILDAVLTDTGRKRLAKGDGSFKIDKFALGDDEIDYSLYNHAHGDGSSYYDLNIMMTPILEAFTNNASSMKSKLISLVRDDLWFLPEMVLHTTRTPYKQYSATNLHLLAVDQATVNQWNDVQGQLFAGVLNAKSPTTDENTNRVRVEQGINHGDSFNHSLEVSLREAQYIVEMDNRFGVLTDVNGEEKPVSYIDDDNIASYYLSSNDANIVFTDEQLPDQNNTDAAGALVNRWDLLGARGSRLEFKVRASISLATSETLFNELGNTTTDDSAPDDGNYKYIDTNIRVTGATTGASIDIPVRYVKKTT